MKFLQWRSSSGMALVGAVFWGAVEMVALARSRRALRSIGDGRRGS